jgi:hypothetical protein
MKVVAVMSSLKTASPFACIAWEKTTRTSTEVMA